MLTRSGLVQMDEVEGLRFRQSSEDSVSLAPSLAEPINLEGQQPSRTFHFLPTLRSSDTCQRWSEGICFWHTDLHYAQMRGELEYIAQSLEAESWSVAVDQSYLKSLNKEAVKRQDVIYGRILVDALLKMLFPPLGWRKSFFLYSQR